MGDARPVDLSQQTQRVRVEGGVGGAGAIDGLAVDPGAQVKRALPGQDVGYTFDIMETLEGARLAAGEQPGDRAQEKRRACQVPAHGGDPLAADRGDAALDDTEEVFL